MAVLDFANDFSVLLIGLAIIVGLSATMIVWVAMYHDLSQKQRHVAEIPSRDADQRDAA